jgi:hypothetical protein
MHSARPTLTCIRRQWNVTSCLKPFAIVPTAHDKINGLGRFFLPEFR